MRGRAPISFGRRLEGLTRFSLAAENYCRIRATHSAKECLISHSHRTRTRFSARFSRSVRRVPRCRWSTFFMTKSLILPWELAVVEDLEPPLRDRDDTQNDLDRPGSLEELDVVLGRLVPDAEFLDDEILEAVARHARLPRGMEGGQRLAESLELALGAARWHLVGHHS